jgi:hypothetical protein
VSVFQKYPTTRTATEGCAVRLIVDNTFVDSTDLRDHAARQAVAAALTQETAHVPQFCANFWDSIIQVENHAGGEKVLLADLQDGEIFAMIGIAIVILVVIGVVIGGIGIVLSQVIK